MRSGYHRVPGYRQHNAGLLSFSENRLPILDESSINDGQHPSSGLLDFLQKRGFMGRCVVFKEHKVRFFDCLHSFKRDSLSTKTEADESELPQDSSMNRRPAAYFNSRRSYVEIEDPAFVPLSTATRLDCRRVDRQF